MMTLYSGTTDPFGQRCRIVLHEKGMDITVFTGLTEDYPELPEPYNNLAVLYASQSKYEAAKNALEMAIRTHPSYATAYENLGDIYAKMASLAYDKALAIDSKNPTAQTKLALIKDMMSESPLHKPAAAKPAVAVATKPVAKPIVAESKPAPTNPVSKRPSPAGRRPGQRVTSMPTWPPTPVISPPAA